MKLTQILLASVVATGSLVAAPFVVTVDTSALANGTMGFLDIQFNGAGNPTPFGEAIVTDFAGSNLIVDSSLASTVGAVSGDLDAGPLALANTDPFNDYFVPFDITGLGSSFSFVVTLSGDILNPLTGNLNGTDFALLIFGADGFTPLLTPDGQLARISVNALGVTFAESFPPGGVAAAVPEPSTALAILGGLLMIGRLVAKSEAASCIGTRDLDSLDSWSGQTKHY